MDLCNSRIRSGMAMDMGSARCAGRARKNLLDRFGVVRNEMAWKDETCGVSIL